MELLENFMWKPRGFRETRVFESHGSWPSQASACGRAALGRLAHPLVSVYCPRNNGSRYAIINRSFAAACCACAEVEDNYGNRKLILFGVA